VQSLPTASIHEEMGKFYLEEEQYRLSYEHLKKCYDIRSKLIKDKKNKEVERVSTLLVFLHRKIEI
jgi:hypothetical protein